MKKHRVAFDINEENGNFTACNPNIADEPTDNGLPFNLVLGILKAVDEACEQFNNGDIELDGVINHALVTIR